MSENLDVDLNFLDLYIKICFWSNVGQIWVYFIFDESYFCWTYSYFEIRRILVRRIWRILKKSYFGVQSGLEFHIFKFSTLKYAKIRYLDILLNIKICQVVFCHIFGNLKYTIVFVLTNTTKYAYLRCHRLYAEIRSYLMWVPLEPKFIGFRNIEHAYTT